MQAAIVVTMVVLVSYPEQRALGGLNVWRPNGPLAAGGPRGAAAPAARATDNERRRAEIGYGSAYLDNATAVGGSGTAQRKLYDFDVEGGRKTFVTPEGVLLLGGRINAILGYARTALNAPIPFARLVLRNIVTGRVEARATANGEGRFTFLDVDPSGYIVELLGPDGTILATSELVSVKVGDLQQTTVRTAAARGLATFSQLGATAHEAVTVAVNQGVNRVTSPEQTISARQ